ncbi:hypothetical protein GOODEAATRI_026549 [Goodea atripinnis]|uniref:Uncharacterized protein n=1 Tax=Goodea atripinnis TaxID=208336 RepID=A0ABV0MVC7_9TELE
MTRDVQTLSQGSDQVSSQGIFPGWTLLQIPVIVILCQLHPQQDVSLQIAKPDLKKNISWSVFTIVVHNILFIWVFPSNQKISLFPTAAKYPSVLCDLREEL